MIAAVADCLVTGHEALAEPLILPDPNDRHVLAAAIRCGAEAIVTFNLGDFPAAALSRFRVEAKHPDDLLVELIDAAPAAVAAVIARQAADLRSPPCTVQELLLGLRASGLPLAVARLEELFGG